MKLKIKRTEEMKWEITKKGEKYHLIIGLTGGLLLCYLIIFIIIDEKPFSSIMIFTYIFGILLYLLCLWIGKISGNWKNPRIIKLENNIITVEEHYPKDDYVKRWQIPIRNVYKISIDRKKIRIYYTDQKGTKYYWNMMTWQHSKEDREKLTEVLNEVLKRIKKEDVEIIDKR